MKKIKAENGSRGKTGAVLVLSVCSMLLILNGIRKNAAQLQYQLQQYLLRSAQAMYVPSLVWKEDSVSSGPGGVDQTKSTGVDSSGSVCGRSCRVWIVS